MAKNILLIQTAFLGDAILSTPVIDGILKLHPEAKLTLMTTPIAGGLFRHDPRISEVMVFDKRKTGAGIRGLCKQVRELRSRQFDCLYSLHRSFRTGLLVWLSGVNNTIGFAKAPNSFFFAKRMSRPTGGHAAVRLLSILGAHFDKNTPEPRLHLILPPAEILGEKSRVGSGEFDGAVVFIPGSAWRTKMWDVRQVRKAADELVRRGRKVVVAGTADERSLAAIVADGLPVTNLAGETSIPEMVRLISKASLVICNDSSSLHLASAFRRPNVSVFCSTIPEFGFGPLNPFAEVVQVTGLPCKPCGRHGFSACPIGTEACMRGVTAGQVLAAAARVEALFARGVGS